MSISLIVASIGTLAVTMAALERVILGRDDSSASPFRRRITYALIIATLAINVGIHWIQYHNVTSIALQEQKKLEGGLAFSLWAYTQKEEEALKYLATTHHKYVLGYYYFRNGKHTEARDAFREAIRRGDFVGPSYYILAVMARLDKRPYSHVRDLLQKGIPYDPDYSSLHLERGILNAAEHQWKEAASDLEKAYTLNKVHCYTITRNSAQPGHPLYPLRDEPGFQALRQECEILERTLQPLPSATARSN